MVRWGKNIGKHNLIRSLSDVLIRSIAQSDHLAFPHELWSRIHEIFGKLKQLGHPLLETDVSIFDFRAAKKDLKTMFSLVSDDFRHQTRIQKPFQESQSAV